MLVVCGRNKSAFTKLKQLFKNLKNVTVLGYCKKMPFLLKISHVVISRSGSNLNAEALYFNCIIFIFNFMGTMPQEYLILNHFKKKNYGIILKERFKFKSLNEAVSLFLKNPQMYIKLKRIFKVRAELFTKSSISCKDIMINYIRSLNNTDSSRNSK
ncbi:hypothetical protein E5P55_01235 [Candidatus Pinguicoccus supinus]|uniref:Glycosyl transferase family 28 C-terminal domain-containing protein n=1 Tax=Candidatus Pinguicoccus supinus TaxID=2529394 RepID=A0A7T0BRY3_9BACT|nr:hypothetical protein E5P55_01235 [Candidatus Pinguicoccus supinus]